MTQLIKYDRARRALAEAREVDEVLEIKNQAIAVEAYARQAKDGQLIDHAIDIKERAERRLGELMKQGQDSGELQKPWRPTEKGVSGKPVNKPSTLKDLGIDKNLANRARTKAGLTDEEFEQQLAGKKKKARDEIEKIINPPLTKPPPFTPQEQLDKLLKTFESELRAVARVGQNINDHLHKHPNLTMTSTFRATVDEAYSMLKKLYERIK